MFSLSHGDAIRCTIQICFFCIHEGQTSIRLSHFENVIKAAKQSYAVAGRCVQTGLCVGACVWPQDTLIRQSLVPTFSIRQASKTNFQQTHAVYSHSYLQLANYQHCDLFAVCNNNLGSNLTCSRYIVNMSNAILLLLLIPACI